jgi:hypothetical protein
MSEITSLGAPSLVGLFVSQPIHYLLNSISAVLMIIDYQSLSYELLSLYSASSNLPTWFTLAVLEVFRKNHRPLAAVSWHWTTQYYVNTFRSQLMDTYAFILNWIIKSAFDKSLVCRCVQVAVHQPAPPPFEWENTKLPDVISDYHFLSLLQ